jgi:hypothetical protein
MRSSKSRSRSKQNRNNNRSVGNIINRVFDSSGPEGKVRGTPQQIIDKYNQLARDAQLSNDRVAAENFQQHSEHYTRMLAEATREMEAQRQTQDNYQSNGNGQQNGQNRDYNQNRDNQGRDNSQNRDGNQNRDNQNRDNQSRDNQSRDNNPNRDNQNRDNQNRDNQNRGDGQNRGDDRPERQDRDEARSHDQRPPRDREPVPQIVADEQPAVDRTAFAFDAPAEDGDSGLVETPESTPKPKTARSRRPRGPAAQVSPDEPPE